MHATRRVSLSLSLSVVCVLNKVHKLCATTQHTNHPEIPVYRCKIPIRHKNTGKIPVRNFVPVCSPTIQRHDSTFCVKTNGRSGATSFKGQKRSIDSEAGSPTVYYKRKTEDLKKFCKTVRKSGVFISLTYAQRIKQQDYQTSSIIASELAVTILRTM